MPFRRPLFIVVVVILVLSLTVLFMCSWYLNRHFEALEADRQARATEQAIALVTGAAQTAEAQGATATAQAIELDRKAATAAAAQAATATQQAINLQGTVTAEALLQAATATKQAKDLRATAVAQGCAASDRYSLHVGEPELFPKPGRMYVIGNPPFAVRATWEVTNTGECTWEEARLRPLGGGEAIPVLEGEWVEPGQVVEISVPFPFSGGGDVDRVRDVEGEWILVVLNPLGGDHVLFEQPHLSLKVEGWVVAGTPTPTPIPTSTPTPTFTPTFTPTSRPTPPPLTATSTKPPLRPTATKTGPPPPPTATSTKPPLRPTATKTEPPPPPTATSTEPPPATSTEPPYPPPPTPTEPPYP